MTTTTRRLAWFKFWPTEMLGLVAGLGSEILAAWLIILSRSWADGSEGRLVDQLDALARLAGLESTRFRRAIDTLSTRSLVVIESTNETDGMLTLVVPYLQKQAARRASQAESARRRQTDSESTTNRREIDGESTSQAQKLRGSEAQKRERLGSSAAPAADGVASRPEPLSLSSSTRTESPKTSDRAAEVLQVFAHFRKHHPEAFATPQPDSKEWRLIEDRLREGVSVATIERAIDGAHGDAWHRGANTRGTPHLSLAYCVQTGSKVFDLAALAQKPTPATAGANGAAVDPDKLCGDSGWPKWRARCAEKAIGTDAALDEWRRLKSHPEELKDGAAGMANVDALAKRLSATTVGAAP